MVIYNNAINNISATKDVRVIKNVNKKGKASRTNKCASEEDVTTSPSTSIMYSMMQYGLGSNPSYSLFPITNQAVKEIFNTAKLKQYDEDHAVYESDTFAHSEEMSAESEADLAVKYSNKYTAGGEAKFWGVAVSGSIEHEFKTNTKTEMSSKFAQKKIYARQKYVILPTPLYRNELRSLLNDNVREVIDGVDSLDAAREVIEGTGAVYMQKAFFGGLMTISTHSNSSSYETSEDLLTDLNAEVKYMTTEVSAGVKFEQGLNQGKTNSELYYNVEALGGDTALALSGDKDGWAKSLEEEGAPLTILNFELEPISNLAEKGSDAEMFLSDAIKEYCHEILVRFGIFAGEGTYAVRNSGDGRLKTMVANSKLETEGYRFVTFDDNGPSKIDTFAVSWYPISASRQKVQRYPFFKVMIHSVDSGSMSTLTHQIR